jgi:MFS family permease
VEATSEPLRRPRVALAGLIVAPFAFSAQQTMVIPALPDIQRSLHTTTGWATWIVSVNLLVAAVALPILGRIGDQFGKKEVLVASLVAFLVGSVGAVAATSVWALIACRAFQGLGTGVNAITYAIIRDTFPRERRGHAMGLVAATTAAGSIVGFVGSGLITDHLSYRYMFVVSAALMACALPIVWLVVPRTPTLASRELDLAGAALLSGALVALLVALTEGSSWGWQSARTLGLFVLAGVLTLAWIRVEQRAHEPMIDMRMLTHRTVALGNVTALLTGCVLFGAFVLIPKLAETPQGLAPGLARLVPYGLAASGTQVALILVPGSILGVLAAMQLGPLTRRYGAVVALVAAALTMAAGSALAAAFHATAWQLTVAASLLGMGAPFSNAALALLITSVVAARETGVALSVNLVMRYIGGVVGAQLGAAILSSSTIRGTSVPTESAYVQAFAVFALAALAAAAVSSRARDGAAPLRRSRIARGSARTPLEGARR